MKERPHFLALDMESVLTPEIWMTIAKKTGIAELAKTTRDCPDYAELMRGRISLCRQYRLTLTRLREIVSTMEPFSEALKFIRWADSTVHVIVLTDAMWELAYPLCNKLPNIPCFCHTLQVDQQDFMIGFRPNHHGTKAEIVALLQKDGALITAVGDSFNDLEMLEKADYACLFQPAKILAEMCPQLSAAENFRQLKNQLKKLWIPIKPHPQTHATASSSSPMGA